MLRFEVCIFIIENDIGIITFYVSSDDIFSCIPLIDVWVFSFFIAYYGLKILVLRSSWSNVFLNNVPYFLVSK